jgi:DNA replicative helicase MCM subunit Mcm2 (Cdc46/Mcm family)
MSEIATRKDIDEVIGILHDFMKQVDARFEQMDARFDFAEERSRNLEKGMNERFDLMDKKYDHLLRTIDGFISRIDKHEIELAARDSQFERLVAWARKVSEITGVPLESL